MTYNYLQTSSNEAIIAAIVGPQAARSICEKYQTLTEILRADPSELQSLSNIGQGRVIQLRAALELASRLSREVLGDSPVLDNPEAIANYLREDSRGYSTEQFTVLCLNTRRKLSELKI
jgi:DNA repair protein RadC